MFNERTKSYLATNRGRGMAFLQCTIQGPAREETMTGAMMASGVAVGIATLICYLLMTRLQNRRVVSGSCRDDFGWVGGADIGDGGSHFVLSGNDSTAAGHSGAENDCGGGDSGGGDGGGEPAEAINNPP
jgi:hypothetical protein